MTQNTWQVFDLAEIKGKLKGEAVEYLEFLNVPALNCGIYFLAAGSTDMQAPHDEDEVYMVLSGKANMRLGDEERAVPAVFAAQQEQVPHLADLGHCVDRPVAVIKWVDGTLIDMVRQVDT